MIWQDNATQSESRTQIGSIEVVLSRGAEGWRVHCYPPRFVVAKPDVSIAAAKDAAENALRAPQEPTCDEVAAAIEHRCNVAGLCGHHAAGRPAADACEPAPGAYVARRHAEVLAEIERLRAREWQLRGLLQLLDLLGGEPEVVGEEVPRLHDRASLVNLAAWALRGIALHDGEQP